MKNTIRVSSGFLSLLFCAALPAHADEWKYEFTPYIWASDIYTTAGGPGGNSASSDMMFHDIADMLDAGWMSMFEARNGNWSIMNDIIYMKLSDGASASKTGRLGFVSGNANVGAEFQEGFFDLAAGYTPDNSNTTFYGGARYVYLAADVNASVAASLPSGSLASNKSGSAQENWLDPMVGVRQVLPINDKWSGVLQFDTSGGVDTDYVYVGTANLKYKLSGNVDMRIGYRYARLEKDDSDLLFEQTSKGFMAGVGIKF